MSADRSKRLAKPNGREPWWMSPVNFLLFFSIPMFLLFSLDLWRMVESASDNIQYPSPIYMGLGDFLIGVGALLAMVFGAVMCRSFIRTPPQFKRGVDLPAAPAIGLDVLFLCAILGYVVWFGPMAVTNPKFLLAALTGQPGATYAIRATIQTTPGITTMTQFGLSFVCVWAYYAFTKPGSLPKRHFYFAGVLFVLAAVRAFLWSERIAIIELVIPVALYAIKYISFRGLIARCAVALGPYLSLIALPLVFVLFEINRSWKQHYSQIYDSVWSFGFDRIEVYYISSINNGVGLLHTTDWPTWTGGFSLLWLYKMPIIGPIMKELFHPTALDDFKSFLLSSADIEFNNSSGIYPAFHDWGLVGGIFVFAAGGAVIQFSYSYFKRGGGIWGILYPLYFYGLFEMLRITYLSDPRCFVAFVGIFLFYWLERQFGRKYLN